MIDFTLMNFFSSGKHQSHLFCIAVLVSLVLRNLILSRYSSFSPANLRCWH